MMEAILIGETSKLEKIWTENFRRTGTFHALVISGVHVTVLAGVLLFLLRLCAAAGDPRAGHHGVRGVAVRAGFRIFSAGGARGGRLQLVPDRAILLPAGTRDESAGRDRIVYLLCDPGQMFDASFQLSFLCVAAIGALAAPMLAATSGPLSKGSRGLENIDIDPHLEPRVAQFRVELRLAAETIYLWTRVPRRWILTGIAWIVRIVLFAFEMAVISTVIQIGLALPMAEYFHRVSFTGLTANLLIVPLLNAVVPIGFVAIFTGWRWLAAVAAGLLKLAAKIAAWHAALEPSWRVPDPPLWLALAFVAALVSLAMRLPKSSVAMAGGCRGARVFRDSAVAAVDAGDRAGHAGTDGDRRRARGTACWSCFRRARRCWSTAADCCSSGGSGSRISIPAKTWSRRICGTGVSGGSTCWSRPTRMRITRGAAAR